MTKRMKPLAPQLNAENSVAEKMEHETMIIDTESPEGKGEYEMESLAEALPKEQERCREILAAVIALGLPQTLFYITCLREELAEADSAAASGDLAAMIRAYQKLKEWER